MFFRALAIAAAVTTFAAAQTTVGRPAVAVSGHRMGTFVQAEPASGQVVKNAPYLAEAVTETIQVLADGNRIVRRDSVTVARDSEGRTRRDMAIPGMENRVSVIYDPLANVSYTLNHKSKTAQKMSGRGMTIHLDAKAAKPVAGAAAPADVMMFRPEAAAPIGAAGSGPVLEGGPVAFSLRMPSGDNAKTESLGKKSIDGVVAEGTRVINVIPAGEIGNERAIESVYERWYSPELQILISSTHKDPMFGETTYKLNNLSRSEPLKSVFEVPADYTVQDGPIMMGDPGMRFERKFERKIEEYRQEKE